MKKALLITAAVIVGALITALQQSRSEHVYIANAEQAAEAFIRAYSQEVGPLDAVTVYRWPRLLRPGDILEETFLPLAPSIRIDKPSWLFFVDLQPETLFQHPTQFILIRQNGGKFELHARNTYPQLNGVRLFSTREERRNRVLRLEGLPYPESVELEALLGRGFLERVQPLEERMLSIRRCDGAICSEPGKKLALIIEGGEVDRAPSRLAAQHFNDAGYSTYQLSAAVPQNDAAQRIYPTDMDTVAAGFEWLAAQITGRCDEVWVLIHANSSPSGELEMNPQRRQFVYDSLTGEPTGETQSIGSERGGYLNTEMLRAYLNRLKSCRVKVFLQSSFSGAHLERGLNVLPEPEEAGCLCRVVAVAATARQTASESGYFAFIRGLSAGGGFEGAYAALRDWAQRPLDAAWSQAGRKQLPQVSSAIGRYCSGASGEGLCYGDEKSDNNDHPGGMMESDPVERNANAGE